MVYDQKMQSYSDLIEKNGKTVRDNNLERGHQFALGDIVETEVEIFTKNESVKWPTEESVFSRVTMLYQSLAKLWENGYSEEDLTDTGQHQELETIHEWLAQHGGPPGI